MSKENKKKKQNNSIQFYELRLIFRFWNFLNKRKKKQIIFVILLMLISGILEIFTLSTLLPFLLVIVDPSKLFKIELIKYFSFKLGLYTPDQLLIPIILLFSIAVIFSATLRLLNIWINTKLIASIGSNLSNKVYEIILKKPYAFHINNNSSNLISNITTNVNGSIVVLTSTLNLLTSLFIGLGIIIALLLVNWLVALITLSLFVFAYIILGSKIKNQLKSNGVKQIFLTRNILRSLQEGIGAIREVIINSNHETYLNIHKKSDRPLRDINAQNEFLGLLPRYAMEALGLLFISFLSLIYALRQSQTTILLPLLGTIALGAQRLLPALQQIFISWAGIKTYSASLNEVVNILKDEKRNILKTKNEDKIIFKNKLSLNNIYFAYDKGPLIISGINTEIKKGERIGIIGHSGSGKSTITDIIMGLLVPTKGEFLVDNINIYNPKNDGYLEAWRGKLASVPQNIFLADCSIAENIAFGIPKSDLDFKHLKRVANQAKILDFIQSRKSGFDTFVGERGVKLSGGQKQRIGIARALYKNPNTIIFDEATSSLDTKTEEAIMSTIYSLSRSLTIIIVAHRLSTTKRCDRLLKVEDGKLIEVSPKIN